MIMQFYGYLVFLILSIAVISASMNLGVEVQRDVSNGDLMQTITILICIILCLIYVGLTLWRK